MVRLIDIIRHLRATPPPADSPLGSADEMTATGREEVAGVMEAIDHVVAGRPFVGSGPLPAAGGDRRDRRTVRPVPAGREAIKQSQEPQQGPDLHPSSILTEEEISALLSPPDAEAPGTTVNPTFAAARMENVPGTAASCPPHGDLAELKALLEEEFEKEVAASAGTERTRPDRPEEGRSANADARTGRGESAAPATGAPSRAPEETAPVSHTVPPTPPAASKTPEDPATLQEAVRGGPLKKPFTRNTFEMLKVLIALLGIAIMLVLLMVWFLSR